MLITARRLIVTWLFFIYLPAQCVCNKDSQRGNSSRRKSSTSRSPSSASKQASRRNTSRKDAANAKLNEGKTALSQGQKKFINDYIIRMIKSGGELKKDDRGSAAFLQTRIKAKLREKVDKQLILEYLNSLFEERQQQLVYSSPIDWNKYRSVLEKSLRYNMTERELKIISNVIRAKFNDDIKIEDIDKHANSHYINYLLRGRMATAEDEEWDIAFVRLVAKISKGKHIEHMISSQKNPYVFICGSDNSKEALFKNATRNVKLIDEICEFLKQEQDELIEIEDDVEGVLFRGSVNFMKRKGKIIKNLNLNSRSYYGEVIAEHQGTALTRNREIYLRRTYTESSADENVALGEQIASNLYVRESYLQLYLQLLRYCHVAMILNPYENKEDELFWEISNKLNERKYDDKNADIVNAFLYVANHTEPKSADKMASFFYDVGRLAHSLYNGCPEHVFTCALATAANRIRNIKATLKILLKDSTHPVLSLLEQLASDFASNQSIKHKTLIKMHKELNAAEKLRAEPECKTEDVKLHMEIYYDTAVSIINDALQTEQCLANRCSNHQMTLTISELQVALDKSVTKREAIVAKHNDEKKKQEEQAKDNL